MSTHAEESIDILENRLRRYPDSLRFSRLADAHRKQGDIQQAISICTEGLKKHPNYVTGRIILGRCYLETESYPEAIEEFKKVCEHDRRNQVALKMLADVFVKQGMTEKAGDLYALLSKADPDNDSLAHLSSTVAGTGKDDVFAIVDIQPAVSDDAIIDTSEPEGGEELSASAESILDLEKFDTDDVPEEIKADGDVYQLEETVDDLSNTALRVEAEDMSDRMSMMFDEEGSIVSSAVETEPGTVELTSEPEPESASGQQKTTAPSPADTENAVVGDDISSRIEELFGEEPESEPRAQDASGPDTTVAPPAKRKIESKDGLSTRMELLFGDEEGSAAVPTEAAEPDATIATPQDETLPVQAEPVDTDSITHEDAAPSAADATLPDAEISESLQTTRPTSALVPDRPSRRASVQ